MLTRIFDLWGQGQRPESIFFGLAMDFFHVKLPEKTIYAKIITARAAVFYLRGVTGLGQFFFIFFGWEWTF